MHNKNTISNKKQFIGNQQNITSDLLVIDKISDEHV